MNLKTITLISVFCGILLSSATAYDTKGKFGMGINMQGTPLILFSTLKYGLTNYVGIEPSVGFHQMKISYTSYYTEYDPISGDYIEEVYEDKIKYNLLILSSMFDIKPIQKDRSNFLLRLGGGYVRAAISAESEGENGGDYDPSLWMVQAKGGAGIEHFFTDHFSVYAGFLVSWRILGSDEFGDETKPSLLSLGNQLADLSFIWYL